MQRSSLIVFVALLGSAATAFAERAENFALPDQHGITHELHGPRLPEAVVIMIQGNGCPIVRNAWPDLSAVARDLSREGRRVLAVEFESAGRRGVRSARAEAFEMDAPILLDESQSVGESLSLIRTAEVLLIDPATWEIVYRGPVDDRLTYEAQKPAATEHYLRDALDAVLAGQPIEVPRRDALSCLINFPNKRSSL